jgi:phage shock protein A
MTITAFIVLLVIFACVSLSPAARRFVKSSLGLISAKVSSAAETISGSDPLGQHRARIADAAEKCRDASKIVDRSAIQIATLERQIANSTSEKSRLENRIKLALGNGDPNNTCEGYALQLERVESSLESDTATKSAAEDHYNENVALVEQSQRNISEARKEAEILGFHLEQSTAERELTTLSASLHETLSGSDLSESRRKVLSQIDSNRGVIKSARELNRFGASERADDEAERKARAASILNRFKTQNA